MNEHGRPRSRRPRVSRTVPADPAELVPPEPGMLVTRLRSVGSDGHAIAAVVGRTTVAKLRTTDALELGLEVGTPWTAELADRLWTKAKTYAARSHALRLVAARARTRADLIRRLKLAGHHETDAADAADALIEAGIVNDEAFADAAAGQLAERRGMSRRGIEMKLRQKGVPSDTARQASRAARSAETDTEAALAIASGRLQRMRSVDDEAVARRRLTGYLLRRGFDHDDAFRAVDAALRERRAQHDLE